MAGGSGSPWLCRRSVVDWLGLVVAVAGLTVQTELNRLGSRPVLILRGCAMTAVRTTPQEEEVVPFRAGGRVLRGSRSSACFVARRGAQVAQGW